MRKHTKRSSEFKLKLVKEKLEGNSYTGLSKKWGGAGYAINEMDGSIQIIRGNWFISKIAHKHTQLHNGYCGINSTLLQFSNLVTEDRIIHSEYFLL